jgi:biotin carboxyl carrier protein
MTIMKYEAVIDGKHRSVEIIPSADKTSRIVMTIDGRQVEADAVKIAPSVYSIILNGRSFEVRRESDAAGPLFHIGGSKYRVEITDPRSWRRERSAGINPSGPQQIAASMAGKVVRVLVAQGDRVESGQGLLVVEAMKMQNEIRSPKSGTVERVLAKQGQSVSPGEILAVIA